jgi:hypothetical protein
LPVCSPPPVSFPPRKIEVFLGRGKAGEVCFEKTDICQILLQNTLFYSLIPPTTFLSYCEGNKQKTGGAKSKTVLNIAR